MNRRTKRIAVPAMHFRQSPATLPGGILAMPGNPATPGNAICKSLILLDSALPTHPATEPAKSLKSLRCRLPVALSKETFMKTSLLTDSSTHVRPIQVGFELKGNQHGK